MNAADKNEDFNLWQKYAKSAGELKNENTLDNNIIAAYLDGSANQNEIELVEIAMAADPAFLQEIIELRSLQTIEPLEISKDMSSTLLVSVLSEVSKIIPIADVQRISKTSYFKWFQTAAGIAAVLLVSFFGYEMGQESLAMELQAISAVTEDFTEELDEEEIESEMLSYPNGINEEEGLS